MLDEQIGQLNQEMANLLRRHQDAVELAGGSTWSRRRFCTTDHCRAKVGATAATFPSEKHLSSWVGACPGEEESAGVNYIATDPPRATATCGAFSIRRPNAAVKAKGTIFEIVYRRMVLRLGHKQTIGVVAHRQCLLI